MDNLVSEKELEEASEFSTRDIIYDATLGEFPKKDVVINSVESEYFHPTTIGTLMDLEETCYNNCEEWINEKIPQEYHEEARYSIQKWYDKVEPEAEELYKKAMCRILENEEIKRSNDINRDKEKLEKVIDKIEEYNRERVREILEETYEEDIAY